MAYSVVFTTLGERSIGKLDRSIAELAGSTDLYRIRLGDYRIVYRIDDQQQLMEITIIAHSREVYRGI